MKKIEPQKVLRTLCRSVDWERLYELAPELNREDVEEVIRAAAEALPEEMLIGEDAEPEAESRPAKKGKQPKPKGKMEEIVLHVDGASKGNPGPAGAGGVLHSASGKKLDEISEPLGRLTNNQAEYRALLLGLERALELGARRISVVTDSELMAFQINGIYRVKNPGLWPLYEAATELLERFDQWTVRHAPREQNKAADALATAALKKRRS